MGEVVEFFDGKRIPIDSGLRISGEFPYYGATGIIDYVDDYIFDGEYVLLAEDGANITMRNYPVAYLTKGKFWLNNHAHIMKMVNGENYFLVQILEKIDYVKYNTGTAQPKLNSKVVKNIEFKLPKPEEQKVIGSVFKQLDNLITLHQRKLSDVQKLKSGLLQKMFPKNGEKVPEIRFPEFSDDWEQRKLGNHANILTGGTPKTTVPSYWEPKEIPWMSSGEVNKRRLIDTDNMISKEGLENSSARWVKKHSILIALAGQGKTRGTVAINDVALVTNQSIAAIEPDESLYYEFVFQNLSKRYDELRMISSGDGTRGGLNKKIISDIEISSPTIKEQREIGQFFKQLDDLITLHQRKLISVQKLHSGLIKNEKMV